jgi:hypothetical protein
MSKAWLLSLALLAGCAKPSLTPVSTAWVGFSSAIIGARIAAETCEQVVESYAARGDLESAIRLEVRCETAFETVKAAIRNLGEAIDDKAETASCKLHAVDSALTEVCDVLRRNGATCDPPTLAAIEFARKNRCSE